MKKAGWKILIALILAVSFTALAETRFTKGMQTEYRTALDVLLASALSLTPADTTVTYDTGAYGAPYSRYEPLDTRGTKINAHMPDIHQDSGYYYWFGEAPRYQNRTYNGVNCYRSADMKSWTFIGNVVPIQASGAYSHDVVDCSHRVMYNGSQWIMISAQCGPPPGYANMHNVVAVSGGGITGPYHYLKDLNTTSLGGEGSFFRDSDGTTYWVYTGAGGTGGNETIDKLSSDLKSVVSRKWQSNIPQREANVIFKANGRYYLIHSEMTGWRPCQGHYRTSTDLVNWTDEENFGDNVTYHSQSSTELTITGTSGNVYMLLCDQWLLPPNEPYPANDELDYNAMSAYKFYPLEFANGVGGTEVHISNTFPWTLNLTRGTRSGPLMHGFSRHHKETLGTELRDGVRR